MTRAVVPAGEPHGAASSLARSAVGLAVGPLLRRLRAAPDAVVVVPVEGHVPAPLLRSSLEALARLPGPVPVVVVAPDGHEAVRDLPGGVQLVVGGPGEASSEVLRRAVERADGRDVVLLDPAARVGPQWWQRLRWVAYSAARGASASAVPLPDGAPGADLAHLTWTEVARGAARSWAGERRSWRVAVPGPDPRCTYLRADALRETGWPAPDTPDTSDTSGVSRAAPVRLADAVAAWARLAVERGRTHLAAPHVVTAPAPGAPPGTGAAPVGDRLEAVRAEVARSLGHVARATAVPPRRLYLTPGARAVPLPPDLPSALARYQEALESWRLLPPGADGTRHGEEADGEGGAEELAEVVVRGGVELVHALHLREVPLPAAADVCRLLGVALVVTADDEHHLLHPPPDEPDPQEWHRRAETVLAASHAVAVTTDGLRSALAAAFPAHERSLHVTGLGRPLGGRAGEAEGTPRPPGPLRVLVPAAGGEDGEWEHVRAVVRATSPRVEWHAVGERADRLADLAVVHAPTGPDPLAPLVDGLAPDLVGLLTAEPGDAVTALDLARRAAAPVLATAPGPFRDRVGVLVDGAVVPAGDVAAAASLLVRLADAAREGGVLPALTPWQDVRGATTVAEDVRALYRVPTAPRRPVVGLLGRGTLTGAPPTVHVRALRRLLALEREERIEHRLVDPDDLAAGRDGTAYDVLLVERDAVPQHLVAPLLARARRGSRLVVDVDDDLLSDPARQRLLAQGYESSRLDALEELLAHADLVLTSTPTLAERLTALAPAVAVHENVLDERLWCSRVDDVPVEAAGQAGARAGTAVRLLYMGSRTHAGDLSLLDGVGAALAARLGREVVVEAVGVTDPGDRRVAHLEIPRAAQPYPDFVRWLRTHRGRWSAAVAPLEPVDFNRCKSDLKLLEYAALRLPAVCSSFGPYAGTTLARPVSRESVEAWTAALAAVVTEPAPDVLEARAREVLRHRGLRAGLDAWLQDLTGVRGGGAGAT